MHSIVPKEGLIAILLIAFLADGALTASAFERSRCRRRCWTNDASMSCQCSSAKAPTCYCIVQAFLDLGGYVLHYAHRHNDCDICNQYSTVIYAANEELEPEDCNISGDCSHRGIQNGLQPRLSKPMPYPYDILNDVLPSAKVSLLFPPMTGTIMSPRGDTIRVQLFGLKFQFSHPYKQGFMAMAVEVENDGTQPDFEIKESTFHEKFDYLYEFNFGTMKCIAISSK